MMCVEKDTIDSAIKDICDVPNSGEKHGIVFYGRIKTAKERGNEAKHLYAQNLIGGHRNNIWERIWEFVLLSDSV